MKWLLPICALATLSGYGGAASLVPNARAAVLLQSGSMTDLELIVSPLATSADSPDACTYDSDGFGCSRDFRLDQDEYRFNTSSDSSKYPFYVYVVNYSAKPVRYTLRITLNGEEKVYFSDYADPNMTTKVARIFRHSAEDL